MLDAFQRQIASINAVQIDADKLGRSSSEDEFVALGVDLPIEVGSYVVVAAALLPEETKGWNRNQAIVGGNVVRLYKLISAILDQTCQRRRETTFVFARLAFETIVNIRYLIKHAVPQLFDSYVLYSLRHERRLRDRISKNIEARGGLELPIERRMLNSIERTAQLSEISLDQASPSTPKNWGDKNIFDRAADLGLSDVDQATFGGGSHSVHGNWMDSLEYHVEATDRGLEPQLEWHRPRPQILFAVAMLSTEATGEYFHFLGQDLFDGVVEKLDDLMRRISRADQTHEEYLIAKTGNQRQ